LYDCKCNADCSVACIRIRIGIGNVSKYGC